MSRNRRRFVADAALVILILSASLGGRAARAGEDEGGEDSKAKGDAGAGPSYMRLKPISFSVIGPDNHISKEVAVLLSLQLAKGKTEADMEQYRRQIEDAYLVALTEMWDARGNSNVPVSAEEIKSRLYAIATSITGPGVVVAVLIQELSEQTR